MIRLYRLQQRATFYFMQRRPEWASLRWPRRDRAHHQQGQTAEVAAAHQ